MLKNFVKLNNYSNQNRFNSSFANETFSLIRYFIMIYFSKLLVLTQYYFHRTEENRLKFIKYNDSIMDINT